MTDTDKLVQEIAAALGQRCLGGCANYLGCPHDGESDARIVLRQSPPILALIEKANRSERLENELRRIVAIYWLQHDCEATRIARDFFAKEQNDA